MPEADRIQRLIAALGGPSARRQRAEDELLKMGPAAFDALVAAVESGEGRIAWFATAVLGRLDDPRTFSALVKALRSENPMVGSTAVKALETLGGPDALEPMIEALPGANIMTQQSIILAVQRMNDARVVPLLIDCLEGAGSPTLRTGIIQTLGMLGDPRAIPSVRRYRDDDDAHVRDACAVALEQLGAPDD